MVVTDSVAETCLTSCLKAVSNETVAMGFGSPKKGEASILNFVKASQSAIERTGKRKVAPKRMDQIRSSSDPGRNRWRSETLRVAVSFIRRTNHGHKKRRGELRTDR